MIKIKAKIISPIKKALKRIPRERDPKRKLQFNETGIKRCACPTLEKCSHQTYCFYCKRTIASSIEQVEHIIPQASVVADYTRYNEYPCCPTCNPSKGKKSLKEWLRSKTKKSLHGRGFSAAHIADVESRYREHIYSEKKAEFMKRAEKEIRELEAKLNREFSEICKNDSYNYILSLLLVMILIYHDLLTEVFDYIGQNNIQLIKRISKRMHGHVQKNHLFNNMYNRYIKIDIIALFNTIHGEISYIDDKTYSYKNVHYIFRKNQILSIAKLLSDTDRTIGKTDIQGLDKKFLETPFSVFAENRLRSIPNIYYFLYEYYSILIVKYYRKNIYELYRDKTKPYEKIFHTYSYNQLPNTHINKVNKLHMNVLIACSKNHIKKCKEAFEKYSSYLLRNNLMKYYEGETDIHKYIYQYSVNPLIDKYFNIKYDNKMFESYFLSKDQYRFLYAPTYYSQKKYMNKCRQLFYIAHKNKYYHLDNSIAETPEQTKFDINLIYALYASLRYDNICFIKSFIHFMKHIGKFTYCICRIYNVIEMFYDKLKDKLGIVSFNSKHKTSYDNDDLLLLITLKVIAKYDPNWVRNKIKWKNDNLNKMKKYIFMK
jgi:hypothetical protein